MLLITPTHARARSNLNTFSFLRVAYRMANLDNITREQCKSWLREPTRNPLTNRAIDIGKTTYRRIVQLCKDKHNIELLTMENRPFDVPKDQLFEFMKTKFILQARTLVNACDFYGFITNSFVLIARKLFQLGTQTLKHNMVRPEQRESLERLVSELGRISAESYPIRRTGWLSQGVSTYIKSSIDTALKDLLFGHQLEIDVPSLKGHIEALEFNVSVEKHTSPIDVKSIMLKYKSLIELQKEVELQRIEIKSAHFTIPSSHPHSLPQSISQEKVRQVKRKKVITDPDEFFPWEVTIDNVQTDRSNFRSHAKMSAMSTLPKVEAEDTPLPPLSPAKRTKILKELKEACTVMKDAFTLQRFDRMTKKQLQLIVRIGEKRGQQQCYYVRNIYQMWANASKEDKRFVDPLTRNSLSPSEKDDIMRKIRYLNPKAGDPRNVRVQKDPKLLLTVRQEGDFYHIHIARKVGSYTVILYDLGYVPATIESNDVNGDANGTSAAIISMIQELFDKGRLLRTNFIPYTCCKVHLGRDIKYWTAPSSGDEFVRGINLKKFRNMATELYQYL